MEISTSSELNKFKRWRYYTCADCGKRQQVKLRDQYRAKRLQCKACGSYFLIASIGSAEEVVTKNRRTPGGAVKSPPKP